MDSAVALLAERAGMSKKKPARGRKTAAKATTKKKAAPKKKTA